MVIEVEIDPEVEVINPEVEGTSPEVEVNQVHGIFMRWNVRDILKITNIGIEIDLNFI